jgi:hypothetical protein
MEKECAPKDSFGAAKIQYAQAATKKLINSSQGYRGLRDIESRTEAIPAVYNLINA